MSLHVCILGIDGSGKSTVVDAFPDALAGFGGLRAAAAGGHFRVADPERTILAPDFHPEGIPVTARLANVFRKLAKACRNRLRIYPVFKVLQLACQDAAARRLEKRYKPDVVVLLDLTSEEALERIRSRGARMDPHENGRDLEQARFMYTRGLEALTACRGKAKVVAVPVGATSPGKFSKRLAPSSGST